MFDNNYFEFVRNIVSTGHHVCPRGIPTLERLGTSFIYDATRMFSRPKFNQALGWAELMMLVAGVYDQEVIRYAAPNADLSLYHKELMYGPIIINQIEGVLNSLTKDSKTREAILMIGNRSPWEPHLQPCTTSIQFLNRGDQLVTIVNMRSQDMVFGLSYDLMMFGGLAQAVAKELGWDPGYVVINQASAHVYLRSLPSIPVDNTWAEYRLEHGFFKLCSEWRRQLIEMDWKPIPFGISRGDWNSDAEEKEVKVA